jgi:hybrid cluster-associated redox disulfide protein
MSAPQLSAESTIAEALEGSPAITSVLIARRTACIGCYMARFCTLHTAAAVYGIPWDAFLSDLTAAALDSHSTFGGEHV